MGDYIFGTMMLVPSALAVVVIGIACGIEAVRSYAARKQRHRGRRR